MRTGPVRRMRGDGPGVCQCCGGKAHGVGDLLCQRCWRLVPRSMINIYLQAWRLPRSHPARSILVSEATTDLIEYAKKRLRALKAS